MFGFVVAGIDWVDRGKELLLYAGERRRIGEQSLEDIKNVDSLDRLRRCRLGSVKDR